MEGRNLNKDDLIRCGIAALIALFFMGIIVISCDGACNRKTDTPQTEAILETTQEASTEDVTKYVPSPEQKLD